MTMRIGTPPDLLIKYKESQQENDPVIKPDPVIKYEGCQQLDETTRLNKSARLQMSENARLRMERNGYREYYIHYLSYKNLWHSACEDAARLRTERDKYHQLYLDTKDEVATKYHELYLDTKDEVATLQEKLHQMFRLASANRFADLGIEFDEKNPLSKGESHDDSQNN